MAERVRTWRASRARALFFGQDRDAAVSSSGEGGLAKIGMTTSADIYRARGRPESGWVAEPNTLTPLGRTVLLHHRQELDDDLRKRRRSIGGESRVVGIAATRPGGSRTGNCTLSGLYSLALFLTLEEGRMSTWRLPRFSALVMFLADDRRCVRAVRDCLGRGLLPAATAAAAAAAVRAALWASRDGAAC